MEVLVIDGGSNDGTVGLLRTHGSAIDFWVSEPDTGLYDAMNKGIGAARGRFIYHINAGDRMLHLPTAELQAADAAGFDVAAFAVDVDGHQVFRPSAGWRLRLHNTLHHQGTFYRKSTFPGYDLRYRTFADFDANQRLHLKGARVQLNEKIVAFHSTLGASHARGNGSEMFRIVAANFGWPYVPPSWVACKWNGLVRRLSKHSSSVKMFHGSA